MIKKITNKKKIITIIKKINKTKKNVPINDASKRL